MCLNKKSKINNYCLLQVCAPLVAPVALKAGYKKRSYGYGIAAAPKCTQVTKKVCSQTPVKTPRLEEKNPFAQL